MTNKNRDVLKQFREAKKLAFLMPNNHYQRPFPDCHYIGAKIDGRYWVIADSTKFMNNPDAVTEDGRPMREVFEGFTIMKRC